MIDMKMRSLMGVSTLALMVSGLPQVALAAAAEIDADTVIVTGTRDVGLKAQDSPTPIQVIGADTLAATGQTNVFDALKDVLPSFSAAAENFDTSEMVRSARLRGMSPGEVLVLVNGKRRHTTANVNADQGPDVGSNPSDLDMIPLSLIDHIEVLMDGAAAQYGSDAVAGVINIILKNSTHGTTVSASGGITSRGDGGQGAGSFSQAVTLGTDGYLDVGVDYRHIDFMKRGGVDCRTNPAFNADPNCGSYKQYGQGLVRNPIEGGPLSDLVTGGFNMEKGVGADITFYGFGTGSWRGAQAYENDRLGNAVPTVWPKGFFPRETLSEVDGSATAGLKGSHLLGGWDWDISSTYGIDSDDIGVKNTANGGMLAALGYTPTTVYAGTETNKQWVNNIDFRKPIDLGFLAGPLNTAFGGEYRKEWYSIVAGDPASYIDGGTQSYSGFTPHDASDSTRNVEAAYLDLSGKILPNWTVDYANRFETYDSPGVGNTFNKKLTTRYDIVPQLAVRGTVSDGFHAPTLAQSNFSATNIGPLPNGGQNYYIQLPLASPGAALMGAPALKPEKSKDVDFGIVAEPLPAWHLTADAYQIILDNRIINTGTFGGAAAIAAAGANGDSVPPGSVAHVQFFFNGANTRTRGLDLTSDYKTDFGKYGFVRWSLNANWNTTSVIGINGNPALASAYTPNVLIDIAKSTPVNRTSAAANYVIGDLDLTVRETRYGHADENAGSSSVVPYANIYIKSAYITDIDLSYMLTDSVKATVGGNNVLDVMPSKITLADQAPGRLSGNYPAYTPWGVAGAYFYTRITVRY
jgi:iron complex outermembrane receptor protein